jgi:hypothetical protein
LTFVALEEQVVSYVSHKKNIAMSAFMWTVEHLYALKEKMQMEMDYYFDNKSIKPSFGMLFFCFPSIKNFLR